MAAEWDVEVKGSPPPEHRIREVIMDEAQKAMREGLATVQAEAMRRVPFRTGHLRRSINSSRPHVVGDLVLGSVGTDVFYAPFLERGTGLYGPRHRWITPVHAKALRFPSGGSASLFQGGQRQGGSAGPGFTLAGRVRSGAAGAVATWTYARRVRGIRPRFFMRDAALITEGVVRNIFRLHAVKAARRIEALGVV